MRGSRRTSSGAAAYERVKARAKARSAAITLAGQDIAPLPPVGDVARRTRADEEFQFFCEAYFPKLFYFEWSVDQLRVIEKIERVVKEGDLLAVAMPRGSGKTTLCLCAVLWAALTGRHKFIYLIGATEEKALKLLTKLKSQLQRNDLLCADYPEAVYPFRCLEGEARRSGGQRYYGVRTDVAWQNQEIIFANIPGSRCSGTLVLVTGLQGDIRGALREQSDGSFRRPSLVLLDDPQTDDSARSPNQCHHRLSIINGAIGGLSAPGQKLSMLIPCTVIRAGDVADQLLDRELNPIWQGERTRMVYEFPASTGLWDEYAKLRAESLRSRGDISLATEFYQGHRHAMDAGAKVAWEQRYNPDELSALQHAMNLRYRDEEIFFAEYQNDPQVRDEADEPMLTVEQVEGKLHGQHRGIVPLAATRITAFIDVHLKALYWAVVAWADNFTGWILDYGGWPEQPTTYWTHRSISSTLEAQYPGGFEATMLAGLLGLHEKLKQGWEREGGGRSHLERAMVDANWGRSTGIVYQFCREYGGGIYLPSHGRGIKSTNKPISEYHAKPGERIGEEWMIGLPGKRASRYCMYDANWWKSFVHRRLKVPVGDPGSLSLFQTRYGHNMIAEHMTAEYPKRAESRGRVVDEWSLRVGRDNHLLDCIVGATVAASTSGCTLTGHVQGRQRRARVRLSDIQRGKR